MTANWRDNVGLRPDPYLAWEARTRSASKAEGSELAVRLPDDPWCSLYIRVKLTANDGFENLKRLCQAVKAGRLDEDPAHLAVTIRMSDDEREHLKNVIKEADPQTATTKLDPHDDVIRQFFVYRLESRIYTRPKDERPEYASTRLYDAILAGPPIPGLSFEAGPDPHPEPTDIDQPPGIDKRGVAIGIVDDGIAFAHDRFRSAPDKSRVLAIWLQDVETGKDRPTAKGKSIRSGVAFGSRLDNEQINDLLKRHDSDADVYRAVGLTDFGKNTYNRLALRATHGTHVLDVAAGYDFRVPSSAPSERLRPILAVQLPPIATIDTAGVTMGTYLLQAVRQIMLWAAKLGDKVPLVINFSYGLSAGPKDGTHPLELALNELISYRNREYAATCLVVPAGNNYLTRTTARMNLARGKPQSIDWVILPDDPTPNFLEIWLDTPVQPDAKSPSPIEVSLTPPDGLPANVVCPTDGRGSELVRDGCVIASISYDVVITKTVRDVEQKRGRIFVAISQTASLEDRADCALAGRWELTLTNTLQSEIEIKAHLYIQRDNTPFGYRRPGRQSYFDHELAYGRDCDTGNYDRIETEKGCPITQEDTLSALATLPLGENPKLPPGIDGRICVVGAAEASERLAPAHYTSSGPAKGRTGPDCSAVTEEGQAHWGVVAAGTFGGTLVKLNGSSVAAPQVVRYVANAFEDREHKDLPAFQLLKQSRDEPPPQRAPIGVPDQEVLQVPARDEGRLGSGVIRRQLSNRVPRRRYAGEFAIEPDEDMTN